MGNNKNQVFFLRKIGKIEFILFIFTFAGLMLNVFQIKGGKLVMGLGLIAFALLYLFTAATFRTMAYKTSFDRATSTLAYLSLSALVVGIWFTIRKVAGYEVIIHVGLLSVLFMMVIIQLRKFKIGLMSHDTTSLLYRLTIFWVVGLVSFYFLPGTFFTH
jgi:hypothetical protein